MVIEPSAAALLMTEKDPTDPWAYVALRVLMVTESNATTREVSAVKRFASVALIVYVPRARVVGTVKKPRKLPVAFVSTAVHGGLGVTVKAALYVAFFIRNVIAVPAVADK